jgi:hypothetical protein
MILLEDAGIQKHLKEKKKMGIPQVKAALSFHQSQIPQTSSLEDRLRHAISAQYYKEKITRLTPKIKKIKEGKEIQEVSAITALKSYEKAKNDIGQEAWDRGEIGWKGSELPFSFEKRRERQVPKFKKYLLTKIKNVK